MDEGGNLLYQVVRYHPKAFKQRRPDGRGGWIWNVDGVRRVPYRLPELIEAIGNGHPVFIVEGEKDVDALKGIGITATCNAGGASKWLDEHAAYFAGADVIATPDNDDPGRKHAECVATSLHKTAARIRLLELPGLPPAGDVSDWLAAGGTVESLWQLVEAAPEASEVARLQGGAPRNDAQDRLESVCAADVTMRAIRWLWPNRFALGKLGIIGGLPDRGKGCITADIIARTTKGEEWPCGEGRAIKGNVILLTAEDDLEDTVIPRLVAAGADMKRVHIIRMVKTKDGGKRQFSLISDLVPLERKLNEIGGVVLVVIDPLSAYLGVNKMDSYRTTDVRGVLTPLADLTADQKIAMIGIMHFNKSTNVTNAMLRLSDSLAFVAASRHAYVVVDEPDGNRRLFTKAKNNLATRDVKALAYTLEGISVGTDQETKETIVAPRVAWGLEHVDVTADQALAAEAGGKDEPTAKEANIEFLSSVLDDAPTRVEDIEREARAAELLKGDQPINKDKPFREAKKALGIKSYQPKGEKGVGWYWALPKHQAP